MTKIRNVVTCQILDICITLVAETAVFDQKSDSPLPKSGFAFAKDCLVS